MCTWICKLFWCVIHYTTAVVSFFPSFFSFHTIVFVSVLVRQEEKVI